MARYAVVRAGVVENVIEWDGVVRTAVEVNGKVVGYVGWDAPPGTSAVVDAESRAQVGGGYVDGEFTPPPPPEPE